MFLGQPIGHLLDLTGVGGGYLEVGVKEI